MLIPILVRYLYTGTAPRMGTTGGLKSQLYMGGLMRDNSISSALAVEILWSCTKLMISS